MLVMVDERKTVQVYVSGHTPRIINATCERTGMSKVEMFHRLAEWFGRQDVMVQQIIPGQVPPQYSGAVARLLLENMAGSDSKKASA